MATRKQIDANRANARKSTGPKTAAGKAVAAQNARKHGIFGRDVAHKNENPADFDALVERLREDLRPGSALEDELVDQLAIGFWRNRRLAKAERDRLNDVNDTLSMAIIEPGFMPIASRILFGRYQTMITNEIRRSLSMFYEARERRIDGLEAAPLNAQTDGSDPA